ncbi:MAG: HEAT repeat domain-containing protein [Planctomycetes bacterium]|nr:HEAT repeat domain-containing protein [Planctomycetota bacterium]
MKRSALLPVAFLVVPLALAACASDDGGRSVSSSGGRSDVGFGTRADAPAGAPTVQTFTPATQAFMKAGLQQFSRGDVQWESTRREWIAMGPRESAFLVQTMWGACLAAQARNAPDLVERARHELALIGEPSVRLMADVLATESAGSVMDPATGEEKQIRVDDLQRREAAEVLALIGAPAVAATVDAIDRAQTKSGKRYAIDAVGNMGDRGGAAGAAALADHARDPDDVLRVAAVHGMRNYSDGSTRTALLAALSDADGLVREKAAESLALRRDASAAPALRSAAARAREDGRLAEAKRFDRAADACEKRAR